MPEGRDEKPGEELIELFTIRGNPEDRIVAVISQIKPGEFNTNLEKFKIRCAEDYITDARKRPGSNIRDIITEIARKADGPPDFNKG